MIIEGKAEEPVTDWINDEDILRWLSEFPQRQQRRLLFYDYQGTREVAKATITTSLYLERN